MSKKKKIIILISVSMVVLIAGVGIIFGLTRNNKKQDEPKEEQSSSKIEYKDKLTINLEDSLPTIEDYIITGKVTGELTYKNEKDEEVELAELKIGTYKVFIDGEEVCTLEIKDEVKPELKLKELTINEKDTYEIKNFVDSCTDNSKEECILSFKEEEMAIQVKEGTYDIVIVAKDSSNNVSEQSTKLIIKKKEETTKKPTTSTNKDTNKDTNNKTNTNNNSNKNSTSNKKPNTPVQTETPKTPEKIEEEPPKVEESYVYGTKVTKTTYSNGRSKYEYDFSSFNGNTTSIKGEASSLVGTNANIYNEVLTYTNNYRTEVGATPLTLDNNLSLAATIRAIEIAYSNKFSHTRPNGSDCFTVLKELGINSYYALGENIAYGYNYTYYSPQKVTEGWRNSPGHYANMISTNFSKLGVGYYKLGDKTYYVQMFGS